MQVTTDKDVLDGLDTEICKKLNVEIFVEIYIPLWILS